MADRGSRRVAIRLRAAGGRSRYRPAVPENLSIAALSLAGLLLVGSWLPGCGGGGSEPADEPAAVETDLGALPVEPDADDTDVGQRAPATDARAEPESPGSEGSRPADGVEVPSQPEVDWEAVVGGDAAPVVDPWGGAPSDDDALIGWLAQDRIPAFEARQAAAQDRLDALVAYRGGTGALERALPRMASRDLFELGLVNARLRAFDVWGERRARGIAKERPVASDPSAKTRVDQAVQEAALALAAAHDAESAADDAERSLLLGVRAWLREHPELRAASLDLVLDPWRRVAREARRVDAEAPGSEAVLARGLVASEVLAEVENTLEVLRDHRLSTGSIDDVFARVLGALSDPRDASDPPSVWHSVTAADGALLQASWLRESMPVDERPALDEAMAATLASRLAAFAGATDAVPSTERLPVAQAEADLSAAEAHRDALPPALLPLGQARVDLADAVLVHAENSLIESNADADATRRQAEEARKTLDSTAERTALLISARIPAEERLVALAAEITEIKTAYSDQRDSAADTLDAALNAANAMDRGEAPDSLDETYADLRALVGTLRERARSADEEATAATTARREALVVVRAERGRIRDERGALDRLATSVKEARNEALDAWKAVLDRESELLDKRVDLAGEARDTALEQLSRSTELRRRLASGASAQQRSLDNDVLFKEIFDEVSVVGPAYVATLRQRLQGAQEDPWWFVRLQVLSELALGSLWLIGAVAVWLVARRYADDLVLATIRNVADRSSRIRPTDLEPLRDPLNRLLVTTVDVIAAWMLFGMVPSGVPELAVVLLLIFEVQLIRLFLAVYDLLVGEVGAARPALLRLTADARRLGRRSVFALALWLSTFRILGVFVEDVIAGFATGTLLGIIRWLVFFILLIVLLYAWASTVRRWIAAHPRQSAATRFLGQAPPTVILAGPQALGGIVFLGTVLLRDLVFRIARQGTISRWFSAVDRLRLGRTDGDESSVEPLSEDIVSALTHKVSERAFIDRPKARERLVKTVLSWNEDRRLGLIALLGDTGDGRGVALRTWSADWAEAGVSTRWLDVESRLATRRDALSWVARTLELAEVPESVDEAIVAIDGALEPGVVIVTGLHLAFLRTVGGFDALRALLEIFHADSEHCWILCFYRPSWRYLERLGTAMNIHLVQEVVDLTPLDGLGLRQMTTRLATDAGFSLDFQKLASTGALAGDPEVERERAIESYYRLLAAASGGNPAVALDMWVRCLTRVPDRTVLDEDGRPIPGRALAVRISNEIRLSPIADLGDDQLFVLAAVRVQGELDEQELSEVLNMGRSQVRALVRQLLSSGLLLRSDCGVHLARRSLPAVTLTLRRRHFLHWTTP